MAFFAALLSIAATATIAPPAHSAPQDPRVYVVNSEAPDAPGSLTILNAKNRHVVGTVPVGRFPVDVAVAPDGATAYVTNNVDGSLSVLDTSSQTITTTIPLGVNVGGVVVSADGSRIYVANSGEGSLSGVSVIDRATNAVVQIIRTPDAIRRVAVTPDGTTLFAISYDTIRIVDTLDGTVVGSIDVGPDLTDLAMSRTGNRLYVCARQGAVLVVDVATRAVIASVPVGGGTTGVTVAPDGTEIYSANPDDNTVSVIDATTSSVVATIAVGGASGGVQALAATPDGKDLFVAHAFEDGTATIKVKQRRLSGGLISVGDFPTGIDIR